MAPAGGEKKSNEGFVLLEETEAIEAKIRQQQQQQGRVEGEAPVVEYELASFRRTISSAGEDDTVYSDEDDVGLDDLSLEDMPTDLQVLCRHLRAESLALAAEESKQATDGKGEVKGDGNSTTTKKEQDERRRRRRERRRQERRRLLKHAEEEGRGIHGFLLFAWPIGTRELLFWALLVVFMTTLITLSEGQHTRAVNTTVTRGARGVGGRGTDALGGEGGQGATPLFVFDNVATAVAAAASFQQHYPSFLPTYEGGRQAHSSLSPYTEIALLKGQLRAQASLTRDREEELKWMRVQQQQLEGKAQELAWSRMQQQQLEEKVEALSRALEEKELCLARRGGKEEGIEGKEEKEEPMTLNVVPEVRTVKVEGSAEEGEWMWWWGSDRNEHKTRAREAMASSKEGGREEGFGRPTVTISPGVFTTRREKKEKEDEEWWNDWESGDDWWSEEEDDGYWEEEVEEEEEEEEEEGEEEGGFWWSDAVLKKEGIKDVEEKICLAACGVPDRFQATTKKRGRGRELVEAEGVCAVQSVFGFF